MTATLLSTRMAVSCCALAMCCQAGCEAKSGTVPLVEFRAHGASQELGNDSPVPDGWMRATSIYKGKERHYAVTPEPFLTEAHVITVQPSIADGVVNVTLTPEGASRLSDHTADHVQERVGIRFNGRWACFPRVMVQIPDGRMIMLGLTDDEVRLAASAWPGR